MNKLFFITNQSFFLIDSEGIIKFYFNNYNTILIIFIIVLVSLLLSYLFYKKYVDSHKEYSIDNLVPVIRDQSHGEATILFYYMDHIETRKRDYIKNYFRSTNTYTDKNGNKYVILKYLGDNYKENKNSNPCVVYRAILETMYRKNQSIEIGDVYAPIQIATDNAMAYQNIENSTFSNEPSFLEKVKANRDEMIQHGIPEQDINILIKFHDDPHVKESFFSKYAFELANILFKGVTTGVTLLEYLKK